MEAIHIQLAQQSDARWIAELSRDEIETGLGWRYQRSSIVNQLHDADTNVIVARRGSNRAGFAIMNYIGFEAHLILFAVAPAHRRGSVGSALIRWLITTAEVAGAQMIYVELRKSNLAAHAFYRSLGFKVMEPLLKYYNGREAGLRMALDLRRGEITASQDKP